MKGNPQFKTKLRTGDKVMVIRGGNSQKDNDLKGKIGNIKEFVPRKARVIVEGVNLRKFHKKAKHSQDSTGIIEKEGSVHISSIMYYSEKLEKPVKLKYKKLEDGKKVRGYQDSLTKEFYQLDN